MNTASANPANEPDEIDLLLPWHAAGTLGHRDTQRVKAALDRDPEIARRYELVLEERRQTILFNEALGAPSSRAFDALFNQIDAEAVPHRSPSPRLRARIAEFFARPSPRMLAWSASAAGLVVLLQSGLIAGLILEKPPSTDESAAMMTRSLFAEGSYVVIRFEANANAADITRFLDTNHLTVTEGPLAGGLYQLRVGTAKLRKAQLAAIVNTLQQENIVNFVAATD